MIEEMNDKLEKLAGVEQELEHYQNQDDLSEKIKSLLAKIDSQQIEMETLLHELQ